MGEVAAFAFLGTCAVCFTAILITRMILDRRN